MSPGEAKAIQGVYITMCFFVVFAFLTGMAAGWFLCQQHSRPPTPVIRLDETPVRFNYPIPGYRCSGCTWAPSGTETDA